MNQHESAGRQQSVVQANKELFRHVLEVKSSIDRRVLPQSVDPAHIYATAVVSTQTERTIRRRQSRTGNGYSAP